MESFFAMLLALVMALSQLACGQQGGGQPGLRPSDNKGLRQRQ